MEQPTIQFQRKRKFLLFLPLFVLPLLALVFYGMGGGKGDQTATTAHPGINASLPGATFEKGKAPDDKLSLYEKQKRDSISARQHDASGFLAGMGFDTAHSVAKPKPDESVAQINAKLAQINREVNRPAPAVPRYSNAGTTDTQTRKLQQIVNAMKQGNTEDPEMKQLDGLMDKLLDLQHPERVANSLKQQADTLSRKDTAFRAVPAVIEGNQKVAPGGVVKLKLLDTLRIGKLLIPKGQLLFGACSVTNQRLLLEIRNIRLGTAIIPVNLTVFSLDGLAGIDAPEAELGEAAGNGTANALSNMQFLSMDQSIGTQAATAGISAATGLLSKKVKKIRVKLKGNTPVLLRVNKN
ncbi:conjugative transposon TraM protein [Mucilaginibacter gracilis]|uniref:Conjugative transposon TraM protein n=1 Tax=Mucilaginibacter gracilis TaxID=423350 RepID=A0A495ITI9_9SPHI|nr:conjugative transposon protein TraM [Mucilaginibacter gracilis]RKR79980.1 conjugative transposon TraM protein [Mucilaginibacter gracilis]